MTYENFETTLEPVTICTMKPSNLLLLYSKIAPGVKGLLIQNGFLPKCCHFQNSVIAQSFRSNLL